MMLIARRLGTLHDPRWFRAWAYRITTREAVRLAKRRGRERALFADDEGIEMVEVPDEEPPPVEQLLACADRLPVGCRLVIDLHYREGLRLTEIAEALELPLGTVKSRLAYGLARLRERMAAADERNWQPASA